MYTEHFGLNEKPFSISPDPRYLYLSERHADALAHLVYGISEGGGFIQLTGEVGTGKTTLVRSLLNQLPENTEVALILNPRISNKQFLHALCHELRIPLFSKDTAATLLARLNAKLLKLHAENRRVVLIVDEAQVMSPELLEQVRLLTNLETIERKLLQIILIGQPELRETLSRRDMRQIAQRITGRYHLEPLTAPEARSYIAHRMRVAGGRPEIFSDRAIRRLHRLSHGVPRLMNIIADRALLAAYTRDEIRVSPGLIARAAEEVFGRSRGLNWWPWAAGLAGISVLLYATMASDRFGRAAGHTPAESDTAVSAERLDPTATATAPQAGLLALLDRPAEPAFAEILSRADTSAEQAMRSLMAQWDIDAEAVAPDCSPLAAHGLKCLMLDDVSIDELKRLNRPASLELVSDDATTVHVALLGLDATHAEIALGDSIERVSIGELAQLDLDRAKIVYRPAIGADTGSLSQGSRGPAVVWLRTTLADVSDEDLASDDPELFDADLERAVQDYQTARELPADGKVDDRTLLNLQNDIGLAAVRLRERTL